MGNGIRCRPPGSAACSLRGTQPRAPPGPHTPAGPCPLGPGRALGSNPGAATERGHLMGGELRAEAKCADVPIWAPDSTAVHTGHQLPGFTARLSRPADRLHHEDQRRLCVSHLKYLYEAGRFKAFTVAFTKKPPRLEESAGPGDGQPPLSGQTVPRQRHLCGLLAHGCGNLSRPTRSSLQRCHRPCGTAVAKDAH